MKVSLKLVTTFDMSLLIQIFVVIHDIHHGLRLSFHFL